MATISLRDLAIHLSERFLPRTSPALLRTELAREIDWHQLDEDNGGIELAMHQLANEQGFALSRSGARTIYADHLRTIGSALAVTETPIHEGITAGVIAKGTRIPRCLPADWEKVTIAAAGDEGEEVPIEEVTAAWRGVMAEEVFILSASPGEFVEHCQRAMLRCQVPLGDGVGETFNHRPGLRELIESSVSVNLGEQCHWVANRLPGGSFAFDDGVLKNLFHFMSVERVLSPTSHWEGRRDENVPSFLRSMFTEAARWVQPVPVKVPHPLAYLVKTAADRAEERMLSDAAQMREGTAPRRPRIRV